MSERRAGNNICFLSRKADRNPDTTLDPELVAKSIGTGVRRHGGRGKGPKPVIAGKVEPLVRGSADFMDCMKRLTSAG